MSLYFCSTATLLAFAGHGKVGKALPADEAYAEVVLAEFTREGIDLEALASELQREGTAAFEKSWNDLMHRIAEKAEVLAKT